MKFAFKLIAAIACVLMVCGLSEAFSRVGDTLKVRINAYPGEESCELILRATNTGSKPLLLKYVSAQSFDFYATDQNKRIVWKWSHERVFANMMTRQTLKPGESIRHKARWDYARNDGYRAKAGPYQLMGAVTAKPQNIYSKPVPVQVPAK